MGEMRSERLYENSETLSGRSHMEDLRVDKRISSVRMWIELIWLKT
jgi:hypothetical protein